MNKSIFTPLSGALAQERVLEIVANNLANMNTAAFKGDTVTFKLLEAEPEKRYNEPLPPANFKVNFEEMMPFRGNEMAYVGVAGVHRDTTQGPAKETGNAADIMIEGKGLFQVMTPEGLRYTRAGDFLLNPNGVLVTQSGHPVLGEKGNVIVRGNEFEVNRRGEIYQDGELVDRLQLFAPTDETQMERVGNNYFHYNGPEEGLKLVENPSVMQGFVEGSNVNAIKNLTAMIIAHRSFEAYAKAVSNYDKVMEKSSNNIGEIRA